MVKRWLFSVAFICIAIAASAIDDARLMRYPDINGNQIVFVYAGDIWSVNANGGDAKRLTSHEGYELFPKLSPDGKWIAFSAEYSGSRQIWVMPSVGGPAKQLTYYNSVGVMPPRGGWDNVVLDWTPDSKQIMIRTARTPFGDRNGMYYLVSIDGGFEKALPIVNGGFAALSPDTQQVCFTPVDREFRTWKRYKGGRATELWSYNIKNNTSEQITHWAGSDQWPIWMDDNIYFASDKDLRLNIYKYNTKTKQQDQLTFHKDFDVMWPSGKKGQLVYEVGGNLYKLNTATGKEERVVVNINFDNPNLLPYFKNVKGDIHSYNISPTGKRALFGARGDIFSVPAENGVIENLTQTADAREIYPAWSPNGKYISYYSDATGEYEVYLLENKRGATPRQLTNGSKAWKYEPTWTPDSRYLVYADRTLNLWLLDAETGKQVAVDHGSMSEIRSYDISPDSQWITYTKEDGNAQSTVWVYNIKTGKASKLLSSTFDNSQPVFSLDGKFIFFTSNRDFNLTFSSFEFDYLYTNASKVYAVALRNDGTKLTKEKVDIEPVAAEKKADEPKKDSKKDAKKGGEEAAKADTKLNITIDFDGADNRVFVLPVNAGSYSILGAVDNGVLFSSRGKISRYSISDEKVEDIMEGAGQAIISSDKKSFIYSSRGEYGIAKVAPGQKSDAGRLNLDKLEMKIYPKQEWAQIYNDAWRIFRDYFYVSNMHGVDWNHVRDQYGALVPYLPSRFDLDYVLGEVVSEANVGHAYVNWGDIPQVKRIESGLLGAKLVADNAAGKYKIEKIYAGENWNPERRSPLTEQGVDVKEGDYIISIDGKPVTLKDNPYMFLENKVNVPVEIVVSASGDGSKARTSTIKPIESELELLSLNWVNERREMVEKLSGGRIGYIYLPNTAVEGNRELFRGMYAYNDKEALIIDDRYNGGGFIPDRMMDLLNRRTLLYWNRNGLQPNKSPQIAHDGPKAMLINGYSSSGGDALPYLFRKTNQGTLIGTRTWGGLVGISGNAGLVDGGSLNVPQFGVFNEKSEWIVEGAGVSPDIEVVDRPEEMVSGKDACIQKAVEVLLKELNDKPIRKVTAPAAPDRSKWIEAGVK